MTQEKRRVTVWLPAAVTGSTLRDAASRTRTPWLKRMLIDAAEQLERDEYLYRFAVYWNARPSLGPLPTRGPYAWQSMLKTLANSGYPLTALRELVDAIAEGEAPTLPDRREEPFAQLMRLALEDLRDRQGSA